MNLGVDTPIGHLLRPVIWNRIPSARYALLVIPPRPSPRVIPAPRGIEPMPFLKARRLLNRRLSIRGTT